MLDKSWFETFFEGCFLPHIALRVPKADYK